ncbi:MAG: DUF4326 domain-containing protein [Nanoarchaeota archaeon]
MTTVVNVNEDEFDFWCARGSIFGNPFVIGRDGDRNEVCDKYEEHFNFLLRDKVFRAEVQKLKGEVLERFCKEKDRYVRCHVETIVKYLDGAENPE